MSSPKQPADEWQALYAELRTLLAMYGREDPYGEGDFWLVDDDWGGPQQKVCMFNASFITPALCRQVQGLLGKYLQAWKVIFAFDKPDPRRHPEDLGLTVTKSGIEEHWDAQRMAGAFGAEFRWPHG
jgi:hypothetical protein